MFYKAEHDKSVVRTTFELRDEWKFLSVFALLSNDIARTRSLIY